MDIYIKPSKKVKISEIKAVHVKDVAEVSAPQELLKRVEGVKLMEIKSTEKDEHYLISVIDIIKAVDAALPGHTINNVGETDTVIEFSPKSKEENRLLKWLKIACIGLVLFAGSSTAIMTFHSDAQIPLAFKNYYYIFFNEKVENPLIIDLPYSIGIAAGVILFFNHFAGKKITKDPTPIEVEMNIYETDVMDTLTDVLAAKKNHAKDERKKGGD